MNLDIREMIRTHPSGWESESDGATWTFHALIETPMNSELHAQGVMTVRFTPMDERTVRMKIAEERNKAKAPLSHLVAPSPSPSFSSSTKNSNSNSKSVVSDSPLVALGTAQSVGPPDLALQSAIERQIDYSI